MLKDLFVLNSIYNKECYKMGLLSYDKLERAYKNQIKDTFRKWKIGDVKTKAMYIVEIC